VLRTLYVRTANLYVIRCWSGNKCSWCSYGLTWDRLDAWSTIRAALFCTLCSFWIVPVGAPWSTALQLSTLDRVRLHANVGAVLTPSLEDVWCDGWPAHDSCTTEQPWRPVCGTSDAGRGRHPTPSCPQPAVKHNPTPPTYFQGSQDPPLSYDLRSWPK